MLKSASEMRAVVNSKTILNAKARYFELVERFGENAQEGKECYISDTVPYEDPLVLDMLVEQGFDVNLEKKKISWLYPKKAGRVDGVNYYFRVALEKFSDYIINDIGSQIENQANNGNTELEYSSFRLGKESTALYKKVIEILIDADYTVKRIDNTSFNISW